MRGQAAPKPQPSLRNAGRAAGFPLASPSSAGRTGKLANVHAGKAFPQPCDIGRSALHGAYQKRSFATRRPCPLNARTRKARRFAMQGKRGRFAGSRSVPESQRRATISADAAERPEAPLHLSVTEDRAACAFISAPPSLAHAAMIIDRAPHGHRRVRIVSPTPASTQSAAPTHQYNAARRLLVP